MWCDKRECEKTYDTEECVTTCWGSTRHYTRPNFTGVLHAKRDVCFVIPGFGVIVHIHIVSRMLYLCFKMFNIFQTGKEEIFPVPNRKNLILEKGGGEKYHILGHNTVCFFFSLDS